MKAYLIITVFVSIVSYNPASAARILGVFPSPSKSHLILGTALLKALAREGHEVTMVSPYPLEKPMKNYRDIVMKDLKSIVFKTFSKDSNLFEMSKQSMFESIKSVNDMGLTIMDESFKDTEMQKLLKSDEKFDAVIIEVFLDEAMFALAHKFNAPLIAFSTIRANIWTNGLVGNPSPYAHVPDVFTGFSDTMSFKERLLNTITGVASALYRNIYYLPRQEAFVQKYFPGYPSLDTLMKKTSLVLLNSHVSLTIPQPLVPNMIEIGGFHVDKPKPLPADLQKYMDDSKHGVIYFSMGSNLQSKDLPDEKRNAIIAAFSKLKQNVLWKWESDTMPGQSKNLKLSPWLPQQDILAHPNVKAFITHGGLLSTIEAVHRGVPLIGIPVFGDQSLNMKQAEMLGYGLTVSYENITEESFTWALNEILNNPKYQEIAKHRSAVLHDQQIEPLKKATWWVDYVIRHKGAPHLRSSATDIPLYQYLLIDVIAFIGFIVLLVTVVPCLMIVKIYRKVRCCTMKKTSKKAQKKDQKTKTH